MKKNRGIRKSRKNCKAADQRICMPNDFRATWFVTTSSIVKPRRASSHPSRAPFGLSPLGELEGVKEFKLSDMQGEFIEVWQLHIVAKEVTQVGVSIVGHRQLMTFEDMGCQGEDLVSITWVVEGDAHA